MKKRLKVRRVLLVLLLLLLGAPTRRVLLERPIGNKKAKILEKLEKEKTNKAKTSAKAIGKVGDQVGACAKAIE